MNTPKKPQKTSSRAASQGSRRGAFTLIELILSVGITSVLMLMIFGILSQAMGVWADTLDESDVARRANKVLDALAEDLSAFIAHQGENTWMEFYEDQAPHRLGTYETSTLYLITSTKDGLEDTESFEGELHALAWKLKRANFGTATEPQDSFVLFRAVMDVSNTFAGPLKQEFETTSFETFNETSLRGGFLGLSLPTWKTIDHGGLVDVNKDWLDGPANIFATNILDIKFSFVALDSAEQSMPIQDKDFAVLSEGILLFRGIRGRNNPDYAAAAAAVAAAQAVLDAAQADLDAARDAAIQTQMEEDIAAAETAYAQADAELKTAVANMLPLEAAAAAALAAARAARLESRDFRTEYQHQALADVLTAAAAAADAAHAAAIELEAARDAAQTAYDAVKAGLIDALATKLDAALVAQTAALVAEAELDDARTADADAAQAITDATEALADAQEALADNPDAAETITDDELRELNFAREQALKDYSRASHAYSLDHYNEVVVPLAELEKAVDAAHHAVDTALANAGVSAAFEKLDVAKRLLEARRAQAARLPQDRFENDIAAAQAEVDAAQAEYDAALAAAPAAARTALQTARDDAQAAQAARNAHLASPAYQDAVRTYYTDYEALKLVGKGQAPDARDARDTVSADRRTISTIIAPAFAAHIAARNAHTAAIAAQNLQNAFAAAEAAHAAAIAAQVVTAAAIAPKVAARNAANLVYEAALNDYKATATLGGNQDAIHEARDALAKAEAKVAMTWASIPAADYARRFEIKYQQFIESANNAYKRINDIAHHLNIAKAAANAAAIAADEAANAARAAIAPIRDARDQAYIALTTAQAALADADAAAILLLQAQARLDAALLALTEAQARANAFTGGPFETTLLENHTLRQIEIRLKLLTPQGAKLARSIPTSGTLAERTAAFDAIAEQHSMTFTRQVNLIGSKLGSK